MYAAHVGILTKTIQEHIMKEPPPLSFFHYALLNNCYRVSIIFY